MKAETGISGETSVGELVREAPERARIFGQLKIDYCCGGKRALQDVCEEKGLELEQVIAALQSLEKRGVEPGVNTEAMTLSELCDHIEVTHHVYVREELERVDFMARKVAAVHGDAEPNLIAVRDLFMTFRTEMSAHMDEEELFVFPAIRRLGTEGHPEQKSREELEQMFRQMEEEHDMAGEALQAFAQITSNYTPPEWACNTFRALYRSLQLLEEDMHEHVHKENNILFAKVRETFGEK